jgi:hypothetical protein
MGNDESASQDGEEPWRPTIEEIEDAIEEFDVLTDPHYDDDYIDMHSTCYRNYIRVYKWFKEQYDKYRDCAISCWRKEGILLERIKWLEIEKEQLQEQLDEINKMNSTD